MERLPKGFGDVLYLFGGQEELLCSIMSTEFRWIGEGPCKMLVFASVWSLSPIVLLGVPDLSPGTT